MEKYKAIYSSPIGEIELISNNKFLISLKFIDDKQETINDRHPVLTLAIHQLKEYFFHGRKNFDIPIQTNGTDFQKKVWEKTSLVPYGETTTYLKIAKLIGDKRTVRAVGSANGNNPLLIIIPCHRIISANSKLTGYAGGLWRKQWLLEHETFKLY